MTKIDVSIIIVSYNCKEYLRKCLDSVKKESKRSGLVVETIVVDNGSTDGTRDLKKMKKYDRVRWVWSGNVGFGPGNNKGLKKAKGEFIFFLNPDAELTDNSLWKLYEYLNMNAQVGVVGPQLLYGDKSLQISAYDSFPGLLSGFYENWLLDRLLFRLFPRTIYHGKQYSRALHNQEREVAHVLGAAIFTRRKVIDVVGGFDEQFFMFREETDWQKRVRQAGWSVMYCPTVKVIHYEGKSGTGDTRFQTQAANWKRKLDMYLPSVYKYQKKWYGEFSAWLLIGIFGLGAICSSALMAFVWLINNSFGFLVRGRSKRNQSIGYIATYHWAVLKWHVCCWFDFKSVFKYKDEISN